MKDPKQVCSFVRILKQCVNLIWFFPINLILRFFPVFYDPETKGILNFLINSLPDSVGNQKCLDVGAGNKPYAKVIRDKGYQYSSLDILENEISKHDFVCDANSIPVDDDFYDVVVSFQMLEHLPNPEETISELTRVLNQGGYLLVTTNFYYPIHGYPHDYFRFTKEGLVSLLERIGLTEVKVTTRGSLISPLILNTFYKLRAVEKRAMRYTRSRRFLSSLGLTLFFVPFFIPANFLFCILFSGLALLDANFSSKSRYIGVEAIAKKSEVIAS